MTRRSNVAIALVSVRQMMTCGLRVTPIATLAVMLLVSGCMRRVAVTCTWVELDHVDLLAVSPRQAIRGECNSDACKGATGMYRLQRAAYRLEFWTGNRWYPELLVRVRSSDGRPLLLRSPHLRAIPDTARQSRGWAEYDYYLNAPGSIAGRDVRSAWPTELAVEILTAAEVRIGSERLGVKLNSCRYTTAEGF